ncbi:NAD-dependent epimerase/dehydratase family protein [Butyrivibrio sp. FCS006]|uniref:NAD-dependent epimerase/dehydratase family protein n=1 Tax=Butyrivibrio sp. FCS006 TaxID=1280684 RepID=UPI000424D9A6|nr:NAD(P)-dependent oxidoreductase [Butyrivibrio sp. FCS006]
MKKILIFGTSGNMGGYLVEYFLQYCGSNYEIIGVDRVEHPTVKKMVNTILMDVNNDEEYNKLPQDDVYAVIDMIGPMPARMNGYNPSIYVETNVLGSFKIFNYAIRVGADRILYAKSFADIVKRGETQLYLHVDDEPCFEYDNYHSVYTITQNTAKDLLRCLHEFYQIKTFTIRLPHIYLWNSDDSYMVAGVPQKMMHRIIIDKAIAGEPIEVWGDPSRQKDMMYVKDLCQIFYKAAFVDRETGFYNAGTGIGTPLLEQIKGIRDVFGPKNKSQLVFCPDKPNAPQYIMDIKETVADLGYQPKYTYLEMLEDMRKEREQGRF